MKNRKSLTAILLAVVLVVSISVLMSTKTNAQDNQDLTALSSKVDQILSNQRALMEQMDSLKQELNVIKIRVTQQQ